MDKVLEFGKKYGLYILGAVASVVVVASVISGKKTDVTNVYVATDGPDEED